MTEEIKADYLIIGAGASGLAFLDELLHRTSKDTFVIVDRQSKPGGHWNLAYSFVRLHQGSFFYGVNSEKLERHSPTSLDADEPERASANEIVAYYEMVMDKLIETGRVTFLSQCDYDKKDGIIRSLIASDKTYRVVPTKKLVDATYTQSDIPLTHKPSFDVSPGVNFVPINALSELNKPYDMYVIIGNGKTGIDAILFLLDQGVQPSQITWIISRDAWYFDRELLSPNRIIDFNIGIMKAIVEGDNAQDVFKHMHEQKVVLKLHENIEPTICRQGTISKDELQKIQTVEN